MTALPEFAAEARFGRRGEQREIGKARATVAQRATAPVPRYRVNGGARIPAERQDPGGAGVLGEPA
ncbi:hypothetical protein GCM10027072_48460 [Streptomyces bullii]